MPERLTSSRAQLRAARLIATAMLVVSACGADQQDAAAPACPALEEATDAAVSIDVRWAGSYWDHAGAVALIDSWDDRVPGVEVEVHEPVVPGDNVAALVEKTAPVLVRVPPDAVEALRGAGLIRPVPDCGATPAADLELGRMFDEGRTRWARAGNIGVIAMLYDRSAFERAGLDPDRPPATWDELEAAAHQLRDRADMPTPIANLWPSVVGLTGHQVGDRPPAALRTVVRLWRDGLVLPPHDPEEVPPLGHGRAAIELVGEGAVWGYGSALAAGQAPDADLSLAPVPGVHAPVVPVVSMVWVINAEATDSEAAAAATFLDWLARDEQQAALHPLTDLLPSSFSASREPAVRRYWDQIPLIGDLWALAVQHGAIVDDEVMAPGALLVLDALTVGRTAVTGADDAWQRMRDAISAARRLPADDVALLGCIYPDHERPSPLTSCVG